uniref:Uncharacterized protein n=1 Tax=Rhizophora mucronata TaxID=61149 RepID=A0A2P2PG08_RHIMU
MIGSKGHCIYYNFVFASLF